MRLSAYFFALVAVLISIGLNAVSIFSPDWLIAHPPSGSPYTKVTIRYGLLERCEHRVTDIPGPGPNNRSYFSEKLTCRAFPNPDEERCNSDDSTLCLMWFVARYAAEVGMMIGVAMTVTIVVGMSSSSGRRRVWRSVAYLLALQFFLKIITFALITHLYAGSYLPYFEYARPSISYVSNTVSWLVDTLIIFGVITTGISADAGHEWAAGGRAYVRIE